MEHSTTQEITLKVMKWTTVALRPNVIDLLKLEFFEMEEDLAHLHERFFAANHLKNEKEIVEIAMQNGPTLSMFLKSEDIIQMHVKILKTGETITLGVDKLENILNVKASIQFKVGIPTSQQVMYYKGEELDVTRSLDAYGIREGDTLYVLDPPSNSLLLTVSMCTRRTIKITVKPWYRIVYVKNIIESVVGVATEKQKLYFGEKKLENDQTLADYDIFQEQTLHMIYRVRVILETPADNKIVFDVKSSITIDEQD
ncbi:hypothetical protein ACHQM5_001973 [Ranunculus cassubicifolius]